MTQTKTQNSGRGRPKKGFDLVQKKISESNQTNENQNRWRPKKIRKIDDSINTKIDTKKKEISQIEKSNKDISSKIENIASFSAKKINNSNWNIKEIEFDDDKKANTFSLCLLICSMAFFIFAIYKTFFINNIQNYIDLESELNSITIEELRDNNENIAQEEPQEQIQNDTQIEINEEPQYTENTTVIESNEPAQQNTYALEQDINLIQNFYSYMNNLDFDNLNAISDKYLKNSDAFRTYFGKNRLTNFYNKIEWWLNIKNINIISWDENSTRHYRYTINYTMKQWDWHTEEREAAIVNRNWNLLVWSVQCITTWCSKMPFFQR